MDGDRRSTEAPRANGTPDAGEALGSASALLAQLIPFPSSQSVGPLSLLPLPAQAVAAPPDAAGRAATAAGEPVAPIVAQAASVLDQEMAKGVLAARDNATRAAQGDPNTNHPVLSRMHEFVDQLAALWPNLQGAAAQGPATYPLPAGDAAPVATVRPRTTVRPGERATISMTLRNSESRAVHLVPMATDLLGSRGGQIANSLLEFGPAEIALEPQQQRDLAISATIPVDAVPGCYSGLLVVKGLDYLRALIAIEVAGTAAAPAGLRTLSSPGTAMSPGTAPPRAWNAAPPGARDGAMMREAVRLAEDGELGNSDAIRLLQIPHRPEEVNAVLARFDPQLTREAKSKLTLEAFAPLPEGVDNQRYEPIFDRYLISGRTYTTASGTVVLNEVQYYNGEMVQLYGDCANIAPVCEALAGSGYKPLMLRRPDGRECAIAQFWSHQLSDTSLRPYNAAFVIVAVVPDDTPPDQACIAAHPNGASSVLSMLDGTFDPGKAVYQNRARLFYLRLLDSTRVAIEVGRERMGTDKRPGTIELSREGRRRSFSVSDGAGNPVAKIDFVIGDDPRACLPDVATAAATAGIVYRALPAGTEYVYPGVSRIGAGPVVGWEWRTDILPRLQRVQPNTVTFDPRSEEGEILIRWGFEPRLLGYIPNVRGAVTGVP